jgi:DnaK suppressor protein
MAAKAKAKTATQKAGAKTSTTTKRSKASASSTVDSQFRNFTPYQPKKSEHYMNDAQLAHFRDILNNWRTELMEEVDRTVHHMQDEAANFPDPADRATQEEEFSIELRTRDRERKLIKKIDLTVDRVDQEDYGFCDTCGIEIGLRRLEARPTATQCVDCKSLDEIKERQIHG